MKLRHSVNPNKQSRQLSVLALLGLLSANSSTIPSSAETLPSTPLTLPLEQNLSANTSKKRRLSLTECFARADSNNKEILVASCNISISQAGIIIASALPNPSFNLIYGWGPAWQYVIAGNNQQFGFSEEILVAGKRTKRRGLAHANYFKSALQLEAVRFDIHNRVRRSYAELAAAFAYEDLIESEVAIAQRLQDVSKKRYDAGKAPGSELVQAKLAVMQLGVQLNQAKGRIIQNSARILQLIGETPNQEKIIEVDENGLFNLSNVSTAITPVPSQSIPPLQELLPTAWRERKDLKTAIQQAYANRKALTLAKAQRIPDPVLGFSYLFSTYKSLQPQYFNSNPAPSTSSASSNSSPSSSSSSGSGSTNNSNANASNSGSNSSDNSGNSGNSGSSTSDNSANSNSGAGSASGSTDNSGNSGSSSGSTSANPGLDSYLSTLPTGRVPYQPGYLLTVAHETPIFNRYQGQIDLAKAIWQQQLKQNELLQTQIARDIVMAYASCKIARENIYIFQRNLLPEAARVAQLAMRGYELGKLDLAAAMLAQQQYQQTRSAYFDSIVVYQNSWADLEQAVGVPLNL